MALLAISLAFTLENEGGYTVDSGGPTNYGLVMSDVAEYRGVSVSSITVEDMKNLQMDEVTEIYRIQYWDKLGLDDVKDQAIATCIFDT